MSRECKRSPSDKNEKKVLKGKSERRYDDAKIWQHSRHHANEY